MRMSLLLPFAYLMLLFTCLVRATSQTQQSSSSSDLLIVLLKINSKIDAMGKNINAMGKNINAMGKKIDAIEKVVNPSVTSGKTCADLYKRGFRTDGLYTIDPDGLGSFHVRCDMTTAGGGWTVFQRRLDGSVDFFRDWHDYKNGFGNLKGEFWLGLDKINRLTRSTRAFLRIDMEDTSGNKKFAKYSLFAVSSEKSKYQLSLGTYSGTAGDGLGGHKGRPFSTRDVDNDNRAKSSCAKAYKGAWWYGACHSSNLNGMYHHGSHKSHADGVIWYPWKGYHYSLKKTEMKLRPTGFPLSK